MVLFTQAKPYVLSFAILLYFFSGIVVSDDNQRVMVLGDTDLSLSATPNMDILEDPSRQLILDDITAPTYSNKFQPNQQQNLNFGRTRSAYWLRFKLINQSNLKWYLLLDSMLGDELALFILPNHAAKPYAQKLDHYRRPAWSLTLPQEEKLTVYIRATNADSILSLPVELLSEDAMLERSNYDYLFHGAIFAAELMLAAYNLILYFILRETSYFSLVAFILSVTLTLHRSNPVFESLFFLNNTNSHLFTAPVFFVSVSLSLFASQILQTKENLPKLHLILKTIMWVSLLFIPIAHWMPESTIIPLALLLILFAVILLSSILSITQGNSVAKYFFVNFLVLFSIDAPLIWNSIFNENSWIFSEDYILGISTLIFVLLLSLIQAKRISQLREMMHRTKIASDTKDQFLASMSHELRTPLNAIFGISTLMRLSHLDDMQKTYVNKLEASTRHMLELIGNILDIKKIENKSFQLDIELFKLKSVMASVNDILKEQAKAKNLALIFTGLENIPESIYGDKLRVTQILINLLGNAIKFTEFGSVELSVQQLEPAKLGIVCLRFTVKDTGVGISPQKQQYLFQPFMQLERRTNSFKEGAGLGLAISKDLVEMMGGSLEVISTPGKGSQFFFSLRFSLHDRRAIASLQDRRIYRGMQGRRYSLRMQDRRNSLKAYDRRKSQHQAISTPISELFLPTDTRILMVDDYELNLFVGKKLLDSIGGNVVVAANGQNAILQLQQNRFDIVLMDLSMADMDGFEVTNWIRRYGQQPDIPIIALTAQATPAIEQQCRNAGMNGFLTKPFTLQDLYSVIFNNTHKTPTKL